VSANCFFSLIFNLELLLRYFTNTTSFEPLHVELKSGLISNYTFSAFYAVRFAGLLSVGSSDRYTFSYSAPQNQQSSVFLSVDGVQLSKLQADGRASVLTCLLFHLSSFWLCHLSSFHASNCLIYQSIYLGIDQLHTFTAEFSSLQSSPMPHIFVKAAATGHVFKHFVNVFGSDRLFSTRDVAGSPQQLRVVGGMACASTSAAAGQALSLCKSAFYPDVFYVTYR